MNETIKRQAAEIVGKHCVKWIESGAVEFQDVCLLTEAVADALREAQGKAQLSMNSLADFIASGGLPEATPVGEKTREQLIADKDCLYQENKNLRAEVVKLKAERDAALAGNRAMCDLYHERGLKMDRLYAKRDAAYVRGLEAALEINSQFLETWKTAEAIQAEIDRLRLADEKLRK